MDLFGVPPRVPAQENHDYQNNSPMQGKLPATGYFAHLFREHADGRLSINRPNLKYL